MNWHDVNGRLIRQGCFLADLPIADMLDVLESLLIDELAAPLIVHEGKNRSSGRDELKRMTGVADPIEDKETKRKTWGLLPEHQEGLRNAMAMGGGQFGAPAPPK